MNRSDSKMNDRPQQAISIALAISARRKNGETITDDEVLREHPELQPFLEAELRKLRLLAGAEEEAAEEPVKDFRFTTVLPDEDDEDEEDDQPEPPSSLFAAVDQQSQMATYVDSQRRDPAQSPGQIKATKPFRPTLRPPAATLMIYRDHQQGFETQAIRAARTVIGRARGDVVIEHDLMMSSEHAEIVRVAKYGSWRWYLRDLSSTNGTFVRIDRATLKHETELILGSSRYRFTLAAGEARLEHLIAGEVEDSLAIEPEGMWLGRLQSSQFPAFWDEYLDEKHAFVHRDQNGKWELKNTKSTNGLWYRIRETQISRKCYFMLGEQRFAFTR